MRLQMHLQFGFVVESLVWTKGNVQLTIFADGEPRVKLFFIFRGKGKRISLKERLQ